jgi:hypothetical protein
MRKINNAGNKANYAEINKFLPALQSALAHAEYDSGAFDA